MWETLVVGGPRRERGRCHFIKHTHTHRRWFTGTLPCFPLESSSTCLTLETGMGGVCVCLCVFRFHERMSQFLQGPVITKPAIFPLNSPCHDLHSWAWQSQETATPPAPHNHMNQFLITHTQFPTGSVLLLECQSIQVSFIPKNSETSYRELSMSDHYLDYSSNKRQIKKLDPL